MKGVDICTLPLHPQDPPLPTDHPLMRLLDPIELVIKSHLDWLGSDAEKTATQMQRIHIMGKFQMMMVWKGYLLTLSTPPENWWEYNLMALASLRILSTVTGADLAEHFSDTDEDYIQKADLKRWPPRGFLDIYTKHRARIATVRDWDFM